MVMSYLTDNFAKETKKKEFEGTYHGHQVGCCPVSYLCSEKEGRRGKERERGGETEKEKEKEKEKERINKRYIRSGALRILYGGGGAKQQLRNSRGANRV